MKEGIVGFVCGGSYVPIEKEHEIKCNFLDCAAGCGLAGSGYCFLYGEPFNENCPKFEDEETMMAIWEWIDMQEWFAESMPTYNSFFKEWWF